MLDELVVGRSVDITAALSLDPDELLEGRLREKVALARYGRIDPFSWEKREVNELRAYHRVLVEFIRAEHIPASEDR